MLTMKCKVKVRMLEEWRCEAGVGLEIRGFRFDERFKVTFALNIKNICKHAPFS